MKIGIIGGTALASWGEASSTGETSSTDEASSADDAPAPTPFGAPSAALRPVHDKAVFLNRHGDQHQFLPHQVNYRANIHALKESGIGGIVAIFAVGGIDAELQVGDFVVPDDIIDYTHGRETTFYWPHARHIDITKPFDARMSEGLAAAAQRASVAVKQGGVYGCTQGPRLETAAEIARMARDGATLVGMTAMPEAALAREAELPYAGICIVVNPAAGLGQGVITSAEMTHVVAQTREPLLRWLGEYFDALGE